MVYELKTQGYFMHRYLRSLIAFTLTIFVSTASFSQDAESDPRQLALDIYSGINRGTEEASIALKLQQIIEVFRYRCTRVSDYQVYSLRPNLTDLKVKCSGDPLYGVTVASNGFVSVYGGNGILSGLDRRDAIIYSFSSEGALAQDSRLTVGQALDDTAVRLELGDEYNYLYLLGMFMLLAAMGIVGVLVWVRVWRRKSGRKPRERMKPMKKHRIVLSTSVKDDLIAESDEVAKFVHQHPSGVFISTGKRGKRRLFSSKLWAVAYARYGIKLFETSLPKTQAAVQETDTPE